jgi:hypothetical protein
MATFSGQLSGTWPCIQGGAAYNGTDGLFNLGFVSAPFPPTGGPYFICSFLSHSTTELQAGPFTAVDTVACNVAVTDGGSQINWDNVVAFDLNIIAPGAETPWQNDAGVSWLDPSYTLQVSFAPNAGEGEGVSFTAMLGPPDCTADPPCCGAP